MLEFVFSTILWLVFAKDANLAIMFLHWLWLAGLPLYFSLYFFRTSFLFQMDFFGNFSRILVSFLPESNQPPLDPQEIHDCVLYRS